MNPTKHPVDDSLGEAEVHEVAPPGAGNEWFYHVEAGTRVKIISVGYYCQVGATVAIRRHSVVYNSSNVGGYVITDMVMTDGVAANKNLWLWWFLGLGRPYAETPNQLFCYGTLPDLILEHPGYIYCQTQNRPAGEDTYTNIRLKLLKWRLE